MDGADIFDGDGLHAQLYDLFYGNAPNLAGDQAFYRSLAHGRARVLDAACGTGRLLEPLCEEGRELFAFDASATLLRRARVHAERLSQAGRSITLSRQRLESFRLPGAFDLILVAYYGFSYLLSEQARRDCLRCLAAHLAPDGIAVLHLPSPRLLSREVPEGEIDAMRASYQINRESDAAPLRIDQSVVAMDYDQHRKIASVTSSIEVFDPSGQSMRRDQAVMRYAHLDVGDLQALASEAGLRIIKTRAGFNQDATSELIAMLGHSEPRL